MFSHCSVVISDFRLDKLLDALRHCHHLVHSFHLHTQTVHLTMYWFKRWHETDAQFVSIEYYKNCYTYIAVEIFVSTQHTTQCKLLQCIIMAAFRLQGDILPLIFYKFTVSLSCPNYTWSQQGPPIFESLWSCVFCIQESC